MKLSKAYLEAVKTIKDKGFSHIKIELEAGLDRRTSDNREACECDNGLRHCDDCNGQGYSTGTNPHSGEEFQNECVTCEGEGSYDCSDCGGTGRRAGDDWSNDGCLRWIENFLQPATRKALVFARFYFDGSVDSELTFTMKIEDAYLATEVMEAFLHLGDAIGNGINVSNAGMHMAILPQAKYPCTKKLDSKKIANFKTEVTKLLPALYFTAATGKQTRPLGYRMPAIKSDEKRSAIYTRGDTIMEFRIFDTCYMNPGKLLENIEIIAKTLDYYSDKKLAVNFKEFGFFDTNDLKKQYDSLPSIKALDETLRYVKPNKLTIKKMKADRGVLIDKRALQVAMKANLEANRSKYKKYVQEHFRYHMAKIEAYYNTEVKYFQLRIGYFKEKDLVSLEAFQKIATEKGLLGDFKPLRFEAWYQENELPSPYFKLTV